MSPKSGAIRGLSARDLPDKPAVKGSEKLYSAIVMPQCVLFDSLQLYHRILQYYAQFHKLFLLNMYKNYLLTQYIVHTYRKTKDLKGLFDTKSTTVKKYTL